MHSISGYSFPGENTTKVCLTVYHLCLVSFLELVIHNIITFVSRNFCKKCSKPNPLSHVTEKIRLLRSTQIHYLIKSLEHLCYFGNFKLWANERSWCHGRDLFFFMQHNWPHLANLSFLRTTFPPVFSYLHQSFISCIYLLLNVLLFDADIL